MDAILRHCSLNATLKGVQTLHGTTPVNHYRGIRYAHIPGRFQLAVPLDNWDNETLDCTSYGPICPQNYVDVGYLLRIPGSIGKQAPVFPQHEFNCLNINVSTPATGIVSNAKLFPVILWIHGGSQVVTFPPSEHPVSDPSNLVAQGTASGKPIIFVSFNYRLNIFGFGDGVHHNLALKDQRLAISWVTKHVAGFGGDKDNITICGESAGAVYAHAHLCTSAPVKRGILQSGSLFLSPPLPLSRSAYFLDSLSQRLLECTGYSLQNAPVAEVLQQLEQSNINTLFIVEEPDMKSWKTRLIDVDELMIGDVEFESIIWRSGVEKMTAGEINTIFTHPEEPYLSQALLEAYQISPTNHAVSRIGALDFLNDARFAHPISLIAETRKSVTRPGMKTFRYLFDQPSPFQESSRAHHAVDLLYLFGSYSESFRTDKQRKLGHIMREKWITFANGEAPWDGLQAFAFGPYGYHGEISIEEYGERRRASAWQNLATMDQAELDRIFSGLATGRISLLN